MHNMDMLKVAGYSFGKSLIDNLYDCFCLNQYPWEFSLHSLHMYNNTMSTSGTWNSSYICTLKRTNRSWQESCRPIKLFFGLELQTTFSWLADTESIKFQRRLIDLSKTEKRVRYWCPAAHVLPSFLYMIGLFVRPQTQRERNVVRFSARLPAVSLFLQI